MKYTRLDLKKRKKENVIFFVTIILTLMLAFIIGTLVFNVFIKGNGISNTPKKTNGVQKVSNVKNKGELRKNIKSFNFCVVQCGVYTKKENAMKIIEKVSKYGKPFIVEEDKKYKVVMGIYEDEKENEVIKKLNSNSIETSKKNICVQSKELCDVEIGEIIDAQIKVLNKLYEKDVQSYKSNELKKWTTKLQEVDKNSKNYIVLKEIKDYIKKLPEKISKDKLVEIQSFTYNQLNKIKK